MINIITIWKKSSLEFSESMQTNVIYGQDYTH